MSGPHSLVRWLVAAPVVLLVLLGAASGARADAVTLVSFGLEGCPHCERLDEVLDDLEQRYGDALTIERHELSGDPAARALWEREVTLRGQQPTAVPTVILGERIWVGFDERIREELEAAVASMVAGAPAGPPAPGEAPTSPPTVDDVVDVPLFGAVDVAARSAVGATIVIAAVDGFNPCSLWVLTVLLAMVLHAGAGRARVAVVGVTFLTVTGLIYGAFIAGVFTVLGFVEHLGAIRVGVAAIALVVGLVHVKDYAVGGRGFSFSIPERAKPRIYRGGRAIRDPRRPLPGVLVTTVALAAGIALVELPCTAGFPVVWSGVLRTQGVEGPAVAALLGLYLFVYVLDELLLFAVVLVTLRVTRFQDRHGRLLKLLAGVVLVAIGGVLLVAPALMEDPLGAVLVLAVAVLVAVAIDRVARRGRPPADEVTGGDLAPAGRADERTPSAR
jgi:thiol-disulfide isomerase/thioredoxin